MKLTIYRKLLLSYLAMAFLTVLASAYAIFSLQQLNDLAYRIINDDFAVVDRSKSLLDGVLLLNRQERPDPGKARSVFLSLIQRYPQSRWRPAAEAFIRLIDERDAFGEMSRLDRLLVDKTGTERLRALQENDQLKKAIRELTEKLQLETAVLAQENEQMKRDIQRLKALEIELQKRERMLR